MSGSRVGLRKLAEDNLAIRATVAVVNDKMFADASETNTQKYA